MASENAERIKDRRKSDGHNDREVAFAEAIRNFSERDMILASSAFGLAATLQSCLLSERRFE